MPTADHVLHQRALPVLVAFRSTIMQDLEELGDMNALQQALAIYDEWKQDTERAGQAKLLMDLLAERFDAVPPEVAVRIEHAPGDVLKLWARRVLKAQSLDEVFA